MKEEKKEAKRQKEEQKAQRKEEKRRLKAERKELKEARKKEKQEALLELEELPEVEEGQGEALRCGPEVEECIPVGKEGREDVAAGVIEAAQEPQASLEEAGRREEASQERREGVAGESSAALPEAPEDEEERWFARLRKNLSKSHVNFVAPLSRAMASTWGHSSSTRPANSSSLIGWPSICSRSRKV